MNANLLTRTGLLLVVVALLVTGKVQSMELSGDAGDTGVAAECARQMLIAATRDRHLTGEATCRASAA